MKGCNYDDCAAVVSNKVKRQAKLSPVAICQEVNKNAAAVGNIMKDEYGLVMHNISIAAVLSLDEI